MIMYLDIFLLKPAIGKLEDGLICNTVHRLTVSITDCLSSQKVAFTLQSQP